MIPESRISSPTINDDNRTRKDHSINFSVSVAAVRLSLAPDRGRRDHLLAVVILIDGSPNQMRIHDRTAAVGRLWRRTGRRCPVPSRLGWCHLGRTGRFFKGIDGARAWPLGNNCRHHLLHRKLISPSSEVFSR